MIMQHFDEQFRELYTTLAKIAFEYVNCNAEEVECVYVFGSMESGSFFYKAFYSINGKIVGMHEVNTVSRPQYDISDERQVGLLKSGVEYLEKIADLFKVDGKEIPTFINILYQPKTGKSDSNVSHEIHYMNDSEIAAGDVYNEWFNQVKGAIRYFPHRKNTRTKDTFKKFLITKLHPIFENEFGMQRGGKCLYKIVGDNIGLYVWFEPWRFNYPGNYGFNILLGIIGVKQGVKQFGSIEQLIKAGHHPIRTINIKDIISEPPLPYFLTGDNDEEIIMNIQADIKNESVEKLMAIQNRADLGSIFMRPENRQYIYI